MIILLAAVELPLNIGTFVYIQYYLVYTLIECKDFIFVQIIKRIHDIENEM